MTRRPTPDIRLVERMAAGDRGAHEEFSERHRLSLYAQVYSLLVDAAAAGRGVVETFEHARRAAQGINPGARSAFAWLSESARPVAQRRGHPAQARTASACIA